MTQRFCLLFLAVVSLGANAQSYQKTASGIRLSTDSSNIEIRFYTASIVQVLKSPKNRQFEKKSLSVIAVPQKTAFSISAAASKLTLKTSKLSVVVNPLSGDVSFIGPAGNLLLQEKPASTSFTPFNDAGDSTFSVSQGFTLDKDEAIYGLGQQQRGKMNQRNLKLHMVQDNVDDYIPFFQSLKGYGLFWDNYSPTDFSDDQQTTSFSSEVGDCMDYYLMYGGNADGVIAGMRYLTGQAPMFPLWTYGFWQSRERYKSQDELLTVVNKYRQLKVPLDGIVQDWQYWGDNEHWNAMEFLNPSFPDPQKMVDDVHKQNAHIAISIWNSFGPKTKQFDELDKMKALLSFKTWPLQPDTPTRVRVYDPYNPDARQLYWRYLKKGMLKFGFDAWWMDSSEPDHMEARPEDLDNPTYLGSFRKVRNAFPLMTVGGVFQNQRMTDSSKRIFIFTRSAFAGQQRYGANTWSGDVVSSWRNLRKQISAGLNFSLCGIPHWNADIGGFFLWEFPRGIKDAEYRELYARWLQFGTFTPMMRSHGTDAPREIYQFGKQGDKVYDVIEKYIHLRYSLLPYIYATSWDVTAKQSSMMRALVMDFANDKKALDIDDEFMFGNSLLVSPVTTAMYVKRVPGGKDSIMAEDFSTVKSKATYLPAGHKWYDFWTGDRFTGGATVEKQTPLDIIPLYVKAGAILPIGPSVQYAEEKKWDNLEIRVYPGSNGKFVLYEDENDNYNYEKGAYTTIDFLWNDAQKTLTIDKRKGKFPGMVATRKFQILLVSPGKGAGESPAPKPDKMVNYMGKKIVVTF